ncbi:MAG: hypothetical protein ACRDE5_12940 [Ginsengibacter sp.]
MKFVFIVFFSVTNLCYGQINKTLYWLYLGKDDFMNIYTNSGDQKIVLQFQVQDTLNTSLFRLCAWACYNNDYNDNVPEAVIRPYNKVSAILITASTILGDQKIKRNFINKIYKAFNPAPGQTAATYIIFEPKIDANNHIYYEMTAVDNLSANPLLKSAAGHTDPSPPAPAG